MPKFTFENMADDEEEKKEEQPQQRSMFRRAISGMGYVLSSLFWCNDRDEDELINHERHSQQVLEKFKEDFEQNYRIISSNRNLPFPFVSESFSKLCLRSMRNKKPMLIMVLKDGTPEDYRAGLTTFTRTESVNEMVSNNFIFTGFVMTELPLPAFESLLNLGNDVRAVLYFAVVTHEMKVQFMRKLKM